MQRIPGIIVRLVLRVHPLSIPAVAMVSRSLRELARQAILDTGHEVGIAIDPKGIWRFIRYTLDRSQDSADALGQELIQRTAMLDLVAVA